jgi:hypothetical protein
MQRATSLAIESNHHLFDMTYHAGALEPEDPLLDGRGSYVAGRKRLLLGRTACLTALLTERRPSFFHGHSKQRSRPFDPQPYESIPASLCVPCHAGKALRRPPHPLRSNDPRPVRLGPPPARHWRPSSSPHLLQAMRR